MECLLGAKDSLILCKRLQFLSFFFFFFNSWEKGFNFYFVVQYGVFLHKREEEKILTDPQALGKLFPLRGGVGWNL